MVTEVGAALSAKSVTGTGSLTAGKTINGPPFALRLGATFSEVVPVVGVRTTVTVTLAFTATDPMLQSTVAPTGAGHVPPGVAVAELKVTPADGNEPLNTTCAAGSGPLLTKVKVKVTWFPRDAGFGLAVGGESTGSAKELISPIRARNASWGPLRFD